MNKRVLLLSTCFRPNVGGVETHLDDLVEEGAKRQIEFTVITYQPLITKAFGKYVERGKGYRIIRIPWLRFNLFLILEKYPLLEFLYLTPGIFIISFFYLLTFGRKIETIHAQGISAGAVGLLLSVIFGKKLLISTHSIYHFPKSGLYRSFVAFLFGNSNQVLTLSKQSKKEVVNIGVSKDKVSVFTYWVDQNKFRTYNKQHRKKLRKKLGWERKFICFFVGRLVEVKGIKELLEAAKLVNGNILISMAGTGPLEKLITSYKLQISKLQFLGKVENDKLPMYYNAADVLTIPSTHEEGFGRVILEALSCGLPVIGSRRGAIPEAMDESVGYFIDVTPENIARLINKISKNKKDLDRKAKNARVFAEKRFSSKNAEMIVKYYI